MSDLRLTQNAYTAKRSAILVHQPIVETDEVPFVDSLYQWNLVPTDSSDAVSCEIVDVEIASPPELIHIFDKKNNGRRMHVMERELIRLTLKECGGNRHKAARILGVSEKTIYNKINTLNIK